MPTLFDSFEIGATTLQNRIIMAPLTRNRAHSDGTPKDMAVEYYRQRAGAGLIITEATQINPMGKGYIDTPGIHSDAQVEGWKKITDAVHEGGGKIFLQLWHVGRISHHSLLPQGVEKPFAPSAIKAEAQTFTGTQMEAVTEPKAMSLEEIKSTIADYKIAAENAKKAGFDGVEIHAANGYLIDQFLQDKTNQRDDTYGGSIENRARFLLEVTDVVTQVFDAGQLGFRLSPLGQFNDMGDSDPLAIFAYVTEQMNQKGLAYLHMMEQFPGMETSAEEREILSKIKANWKHAFIANGGYEKATGQQALENGYADAIAYGRPFIANPDLVERFRQDAELNEPDQDTFYGGGEEGYTDYPTLEEQKRAA
jgi:N-ethylmaleimide reductase